MGNDSEELSLERSKKPSPGESADKSAGGCTDIRMNDAKMEARPPNALVSKSAQDDKLNLQKIVY